MRTTIGPDPQRRPYLGMRPGDLDGKPYAKFWSPVMAPLPDHAKEALLHGPVAAALLPRLSDAPRMAAPGDEPVENGLGQHDDGSLFVAVRTAMPGVSPEMVDFWFDWHGSEPARYKLWHPRAHVYAEWSRAVPAGAGPHGRYVGRTSFVDEYIGSGLQRAAIRFLPPAELGFDPAALADPREAVVVCARFGLSDQPVDGGYLLHHVRRVPGGSEMRSRFWFGGPYFAFRSGLRVGSFVGGVARRVMGLGADFAAQLLVHCSQEMSHLASFLPALHAELGRE
jgi:hypothetical protein